MKPTLILLHAAGQAGRVWHKSVDALSVRNHVVTPDLPGFGRKTADGHFTFERAVEAVAAIAERSRPPVHLCGLSLGAMVAAQFAAERPDLVDRLVLSGIALTPAVNEPRTIAFFRRLPMPIVRTFADVPDRAGWLAMIAAVQPVDLRPVVSQITATTLVVCGKRDRKNLADSRLTAKLIPGARYFEIPHVGHGWPLTRRKIFHAIMDGFLSEK